MHGYKGDDCCYLERPPVSRLTASFSGGQYGCARIEVVVITSLIVSVVAGDCISSQRVSCRTRI